VAVVVTLSKGYDLDYVWRQAAPGPGKSAADYYIQACEDGGEPPGRWWGPGARALGFAEGQVVDREPYNLLFGERKAPDGTPLGRRPGGGQAAEHIFERLLAAEPHAAAERQRELRLEAARQSRPTLFRPDHLAVEVDLDLSRLAGGERTPGPRGRRQGR